MSVFNVQRRQRPDAKPKQLRRQGVVPMALVERSHETVMIQATLDSVRRALHGTDEHGRLEVVIDGEGQPRRAIVKHIESDPMRQELLHVTLQEVAEDDRLKVDVPVVAVGHSEDADRSDVVITAVTDHIKLRGRLDQMPAQIEVDVSSLHTGEHVNAGDVALPEGVELISAADATLFTVQVMREPDLETTPAAEAVVQAQSVGGTEAEALGQADAERNPTT